MSSRRPGEMPGGLLSTGSAVLDVSHHVAEFGIQSAARTRSAAAHRTDERARRLERQRRDVAAEVAPDPILIEILLDVRQVERRHGRALRLEVLADRANRLRTREVADDRDEEVFRLEPLHELEVLVAREKTAIESRLVGRDHQVGVAWLIARAEPA